MKKISLLLLAAFALCAETKPVTPGLSNFGAETYETIDVSGLARLNGTTVRTLTQIRGSLLAQYARLSSLEVNGEANLNHTVISGPATVVGTLRTQNTTISGPLTLDTQKAYLTSTKLQSITVRKDASLKGKQVLELRQGTQVHGPIIFESGRGEVYLDPSSKLHGSITGGRAIKKN